jgi:predicted RND superfamily exporter protein
MKEKKKFDANVLVPIAMLALIIGMNFQDERLKYSFLILAVLLSAVSLLLQLFPLLKKDDDKKSE